MSCAIMTVNAAAVKVGRMRDVIKYCIEYISLRCYTGCFRFEDKHMTSNFSNSMKRKRNVFTTKNNASFTF